MNILFASKPFLAPRVVKKRDLLVIDGHPIRYHLFNLRLYYPDIDSFFRSKQVILKDMIWQLSLVLSNGESKEINGKVIVQSSRKSGRDVYFLETIKE